MPSPPPARLVTLNLLHGLELTSGTAERRALEDTAAQLGEADVVALQEVDRCQPRSGGLDQTAELARALGARHWQFAPVLQGTPGLSVTWTPVQGGLHVPDGPTYGVAMVSRLPVQRWALRRFPASRLSLPLLVPDGEGRSRLVPVPDEPRAALAAVVETASGPATVIATHLSFVPGTNARQLRGITAWASDPSAGLPAPRFLLGDLNLPGTVPGRLTGWRHLARLASYPSYRPRVQLDHLLTDDDPSGPAVEVISTGSRRLPVSDHRAVHATVRW